MRCEILLLFDFSSCLGQSLIPELTKLQATIRGRKCEVHVESILGETNL